MNENLSTTFLLQKQNEFEQFEGWLKQIFYLNDALQKEYDSIYQEGFYVKLYEMFHEGLDYAKESLKIYEEVNQTKKAEWYKTFVEDINKIKLSFTEDEHDFIELRRHNASHIFIKQYNRIQDNYKQKKERKGKDLLLLQSKLYVVMEKYKTFKGFDLYFDSKVFPILNVLYQKLKR